MTLAQLQAAVYDECQYASSPATAVTTRVTRNLNEGIRAVLNVPGMARILDSDMPATFASVASTPRYVLPDIARITTMRETTNDITLDAMSLQDYRRIEPDPASVTGTPVRYVPIGTVAVATQPSDASSIFAKSTDAADTTQTVSIEGVTTGGFRRLASTTLNGTTAVNLASTISTFIEITDFYISASAVGSVTLHEDSGSGTQLALITIGGTRPRYFGFYLWPTPAAAVTYYVDHLRQVVDLANATDEPQTPRDFHPMHVAYAVAREFEIKADYDRAQVAMARYTSWLKDLQYSTQTLADELPVAGRRRRIGHSRLGAYFPADSWS